uniref:Ground-like domain-containing protein n=1 Tax=Panagrolaimus davidi TaxID=227884 RepID=A0A914PZ82_9BILA
MYSLKALSNDYSDNSFRTKIAGVKSRVANENEKDVKCGNESLKRIMMENIVSSPTISKQLIFSAGKQRFQKLIDVVCSRNKFSYTVVSSHIYCEVTKPPVTCFAFFQP